MRKKCSVIMLPVEQKQYSNYKLEGIYKDKEGKLSKYPNTAFHKPQHLCIIFGDEIKEGDWMILLVSEYTPQLQKTDKIFTPELVNNVYVKSSVLKVIASTNPELGLPSISRDFIEAYVKENGAIKEVMVEFEEDYLENNTNRLIYTPKLRSGGSVIITKVKEETFTREQMKAVFLGFVFKGNPKSCSEEQKEREFEAFLETLK